MEADDAFIDTVTQRNDERFMQYGDNVRVCNSGVYICQI